MTVGHAAKALFGHLLRAFHAGDGKLAGHKVEAWSLIKVTSAGFSEGGVIPRRYSQEGENVSPELKWEGVPVGTRELVLLCEDPDAPFPQPFLHWMAFGIPGSVTELPAGVPTVASAGFGMVRQGKNTAKTVGYTGPMPPVGHGVHHYHFQIFALDAKLHVGESPEREELAKAMVGHVLAQGEVVGTYERK